MYEISKSSAQMLMCYETLDDFLSFDGRGSRSGAWQYDKFMATRSRICFMLSIDIAEKAKTDAMDAMDKALNG